MSEVGSLLPTILFSVNFQYCCNNSPSGQPAALEETWTGYFPPASPVSAPDAWVIMQNGAQGCCSADGTFPVHQYWNDSQHSMRQPKLLEPAFQLKQESKPWQFAVLQVTQ